jgi:multimeric flavodoxin WrbA
MRKLKIAAYYNLPDGGAKKAIENILDGLKSRGHKVDVYTGEGFHPIELTKKYPIGNILLPFNL